jgi:hypothetical protein
MKKSLHIILLLFLIVSCRPQKKHSESNPEKIETYSRFMNNKSWGFLNQVGDTIIPLNIYRFLNPIDEKGMILAQYRKKHGYININQDTLVSFKYDDLSVFSNGLAPAKLNGKHGFIDRKGTIVIPFKYETQSHFYSCGLARVSKNNKFGFIDKTGKIVIPLTHQAVDYNKIDTVVIAKKNSKWAFFSCNGKQLTEYKYDDITKSSYFDRNYTYFKNGLCRVKKNGAFGYINANLQVVIPFGTYDVSEPFHQSFGIVAKNNKYGIVDSLGKLTLPLIYDLIERPKKYSNQSDYFVIKQNNKLQLLDKNTKPITKFNIIEYQLDNYRHDKELHRYFILKNDAGLVGTISENKVLQIPFKYQKIEPFDGNSVTIAKQNGKYGLIDIHNKTVYPFGNKEIVKARSLNFYIVNNYENIGMIDASGHIILPFIYESIQSCHYDRNNRFIVKKNNLYGIIDRNKNTIIPIEYDEISNWVEYGPKEHFITKNGKKGLISRDGATVIPPIYDEIFVNNSKLIKVKKNGVFGTINWKNEIVHPIIYQQILWEWPYLKGKSLNEIYLMKNDSYFSTDTSGKVLNPKVSKKFINEKFGYLLNS